MMTVSQIDHVALAVTDPAASAAWYQSVLGLERRHQSVWGDIPIMVCAGSTCVALFPAKAGSSPSAKSMLTMRHLAFRSDRQNFLKAQTELQERKIAFKFEDHQISHSIYFADPDGYQLEITTYEMTNHE